MAQKKIKIGGLLELELAVRVHDEVVDMLQCLLACKITLTRTEGMRAEQWVKISWSNIKATKHIPQTLRNCQLAN